MKSALLKFITIAAVSLAGMTAAQAQTAAGPNRPATVPPGYVVTPFGYFHPSCVVQLAEGDELRPDQQLILHENGTTDKMPVCAYPHYGANGDKLTPGVKPTTLQQGWVESATVTTTSSYGGLAAEWSVPPPPTSNDGQTLYFFPGLEPTDGASILQPVLSWNGAFTNAWGIQSWNCICPGGVGPAYTGTAYRVSPGDTIFGEIFMTNCSAGTLSCSTWDVITTDLQNGNSSQLINTTGDNQTFNYAQAGVLEAYPAKGAVKQLQCSDFPANGAISFFNVQLVNNEGQQIANPSWSRGNPSSAWTSLCSTLGAGVSLPAQILMYY